MKKTVEYISGAVFTLILFIAILYFTSAIGISKANLERDARESKKMEASWQVTKDVSRSMAAMIFYTKDLSDNNISIYVNRPGLSFGYFFRYGGSIPEIEESIAEFTVEGYKERAFVSMNKQQVCKIEIDNGNEIQTIELDSEKPFAVILPNNCGNVVFYDINATVVESVPYQL